MTPFTIFLISIAFTPTLFADRPRQYVGDSDEPECAICAAGEIEKKPDVIDDAKLSANQMLLQAYSEKIHRFMSLMEPLQQGTGSDSRINLEKKPNIPPSLIDEVDAQWLVRAKTTNEREKGFYEYVDSLVQDIEKRIPFAINNQDKSKWLVLKSHLYGQRFLVSHSETGDGRKAFKAIEEAALLDVRNHEAWLLYGSRVVDLKHVGLPNSIGIRIALGSLGDKKKKILEILQNKELYPVLDAETQSMVEALKKS